MSAGQRPSSRHYKKVGLESYVASVEKENLKIFSKLLFLEASDYTDHSSQVHHL